MIHPATQYAIEAVGGLRVVGEAERMACQRHLDDLERQGTDDFPWVFNEDRADRIYRWFERNCRHVEGELAGQLIALLPFQKFDLGVVFGWVHRETGYRRFQKVYLQMARKNAKTTILAGVSTYLMVGDNEQSPKVYCAAVDRGQARELYDAAKVMAEKSPDISKRMKIRDYKMSHITRGGKMAPLSKSTKNKDGLNPSGAIIDEYHAHPTSEIYDLLWSAWGQRAQALMVIITTAGMDVESPCHREYEYCKEILNGEVTNERYFVMIRELDTHDDEHDPANWIKCNPLKAATPDGLAKLKEAHDEAFGSRDPEKIRTWRVKNLNIWLHGMEDSYMGELMEKWDGLGIGRKAFAQLTKNMLCNVGIDLSKRIDLTAAAFIFVLPDERIAVCAQGFMPEETLAWHEKTDKREYRAWAESGWLTMTGGAVTDYDEIQTYIQDMELDDGWQVHVVGFDPYNASHFSTQMVNDGYTCVEIRQGYQTLSEPTKLFRDLVASEKLVHDGSPLLKMCVSHAMQIQDNNENIRISKKNASSTKRVDLLSAILDAMVLLQSLKDATPKDLSKKILDPNWGM